VLAVMDGTGFDFALSCFSSFPEVDEECCAEVRTAFGLAFGFGIAVTLDDKEEGMPLPLKVPARATGGAVFRVSEIAMLRCSSARARLCASRASSFSLSFRFIRSLRH